MKNKAKSLILLSSFVPLALLATFWRGDKAASDPAQTSVEVIRAPFSVTTPCKGTLQSLEPLQVFSRLSQPTSVIELAPEGSMVKHGDVIVRFDPEPLERELQRLQKEQILAQTEYEKLINAELPLELDDLSAQKIKLESELADEQEFLQGSIELMEEGLVSEQEINQQKIRIAQINKSFEALNHRIDLTRNHLHPAATTRAKALLDHANAELQRVQRQLSYCSIMAEKAGTVIYKPLHINGEFRTIRVGDATFRNQSFMMVANMNELVTDLYIPEAQLARIQVGHPAKITPVAFPQMTLFGEVSSVGSMAHSVAGRPQWQKFFHVQVTLKEAHPNLRPGMSVNLSVTSYQRREALLLERQAILWEDDQPFAYKAPSENKVSIQLGMANSTHMEILGGLAAGDKVVIP